MEKIKNFVKKIWKRRTQTETYTRPRPTIDPKDRWPNKVTIDPELWSRARERVEAEERKYRGAPVMMIPSD